MWGVGGGQRGWGERGGSGGGDGTAGAAPAHLRDETKAPDVRLARKLAS